MTVGRRVAVRALVVLASVAVVLALIVGYVERAAVDSDQFANRATAALRDPSVRSLVAQQVTDRLILPAQSDLLAARPLIQSAVSTAVGSDAFTGLFRAAVADVHRAIFNHDQSTFSLTVKDLGAVVAGALQAFRPDLAAQLDEAPPVRLLRDDIGGATELAARVAHTIRVLALVLALLAVALAAGALGLSSHRRQTVAALGVGLACGGIVLAVGLEILRSVAVDHVHTPEARSAAGAIWDAFAGGLETAAWILAGAGAVLAAAARSLLRPIELRGAFRQAARVLLVEPAQPVIRIARGVGLILLGVVFLLDGQAILDVLFAIAGVALIYTGANAVLRVIYRPSAAEQTERTNRSRLVAMCLIAAGGVGVAVVVFLASGGVSAVGPGPQPCEGHQSLCDKPFNDVALAATHNAMSAPLPGWYSPEQERPIAAQLQDGIRGLLLDTYYADQLPDGRLRTEGGDSSKLRVQARQAGVSESAIDAALRLRERIGFSGHGVRGVYLCHGFCELGGTPLATVLRQLRDFLIANPNQIVVVVNEDYVTPADFVAEVDAAGLGSLAYRGPTGGRWPTLEEMIDSGQRVIFLAEHHAGDAPWYHLVYESITSETPYHFTSVSQLTDPAQLPASCRPNRGPVSAPLFLMNGWVSSNPAPRPSNAAKVNAYEPLLRRARECERLRHHIPNLVAVDFYRRGDVLKVVDALNGVP